MEGIGWVAAGPPVGERLEHVEELHDRAGPPVGQQQRQRALVGRAGVDEVEALAVDLGRQVREGVEPCLLGPPVVRRAPVVEELDEERPLGALLPPDPLDLVRQAGAFEPGPEVVEGLLGHVDGVRGELHGRSVSSASRDHSTASILDTGRSHGVGGDAQFRERERSRT